MNTNAIDNLIKLHREGTKRIDELWNKYDQIVEDFPLDVQIAPYSQAIDYQKDKIISAYKKNTDNIDDIKREVISLNKNWDKRVVNQLLSLGGKKLASRYKTARPMGLGATQPRVIAKEVANLKNDFFPIMARLKTLAQIIIEKSEESLSLEGFAGDSLRLNPHYSDILFCFDLNDEDDCIYMNNTVVAVFRFDSNAFNAFYEGFKNRDQKVYLDEKKIHSVQEKLREIQLPKPIKKAFCVVRAGYIIVHTRISKDDIIRHCKNYDELVELIKKFGKNQTSSDSAQKIS